MPLPTLMTKVSPRPAGAEVPITNEAHEVGEDDPNLVWLEEVPLQAVSGASVVVPGFTEVLPAVPGELAPVPGPGEFRVFYTGLGASSVEFNSLSNGQTISVSYTGRGGTVTPRDFNRLRDLTEEFPDYYVQTPRVSGEELQITDEPHTVGEETPNVLWLKEMPLQFPASASLTIPGFTEVLPAAPGELPPVPAPGEFRAFYTGADAGAVEFHPISNGTPVSVTYWGRGGSVSTRGFNRVQAAAETAGAAATAAQATAEAAQTAVDELPGRFVQLPRSAGEEVPITDEAHTVGEEEPNVVWLREVPLQAASGASLSIDGFVEVLPAAPGELAPAPGPGEYRVFYTGADASAVEFNEADNGQAVLVSYTGRGGSVTTRGFNRVQAAAEAAGTAAAAAQTTAAAAQTAAGTAQTTAEAAQAAVNALPGRFVQLPRAAGAEAPVTGEAHVVGEEDANLVWLREVPLQAASGASVTIPGFTEVLPAAPGLSAPAPGPGEFRVFYTGPDASAVEFNEADNGQAVEVSYTGRGGSVSTRAFNRMAAIVDELPSTYVAKGATQQFDTTGAILQFNGDDGTAYALGHQRFQNVEGDRNNNVMRWGYNLGANGARVDHSKHALAFEIESFYHPIPGKRWTEAHLAFTTEGGRLLRPFSMEADVNAGDPGADTAKIVRFRIEADDFAFTNPGPTNAVPPGPTQIFMKVGASGVIFPSPISIRHYVNNHPILQQANAAVSSFITVIKLNAQDEVELGSTGTKTYVPGGLILRSPNGTRFLVSVSNTGVLSATAL